MRPTPVLAVTAAVLAGALAPAASALAATSELTGHVTASGAALTAPVTVGWFDPATGDEDTVRSAADGSYRLGLPSSGSRFVVFAGLAHATGGEAPERVGSLGGYTGSDGTGTEFQRRTRFTSGHDVPATLDVDLPVAAAVTGADPALARRHVDLLALNDDPVGSVRADAQGAFRFEVVPGRFRIAVDGDDTRLPFRSPAFTAVAGTPVAVPVAQTAGGTVTGVVRSHGAPARGVVVHTSGSGATDTRTGADGSYRLTGLTPGTHRVRFSAVGDRDHSTRWIPRTLTVRGLLAGGTKHLDAALAVGGAIAGTYDSGSGASTYTYVVRRGGARGAVVVDSRGPAHGASARNPVRASGLAPGRYAIQAIDENGGRYASRTVTVRAGRTAKLGLLERTRAALTLSGAAAGADGYVLAVGDTLSTFRFGLVNGERYSLSGLLPGSYSVTLIPSDRVPTSIRVRLARDTTHALHRGVRLGEVDGTVRVHGVPLASGELSEDAPEPDPEGGAAALSGFIRSRPLSAEIEEGELSGSGAPGAHRVGVLALDDTPFQANAPYWIGFPPRTVRLRSGGTTHLGVIDLPLRG